MSIFIAGRRYDPHRVRDIDDRCPGIRCGLEDFDQVVPVSPRCIHGREHAQVDVVADIADDISRNREHFLPGLVDGVLPLDIRRRDKDVHHVHIAIKAGIHIGFYGAGEPANLCLKTELFNSGYGLFLGFR